MIRMFVRHQVKDFSAWKRGYDAFDAERKKSGVRGHAVFRDTEHPNAVTVWHDFADEKAARAFAGSRQLREAMKGAGVVGEPEIWFTSTD